MAAVPITIVGMATRSDGTSDSVTIVGVASITGLGIGGGPIIPPDKPPGSPPGIWPGPGDPDFPGGGKPPGPPNVIWPGPGPLPGVGHPIVLPGDPSWEGPGGIKPPDFQPPPPGSPPIVIPGGRPVHPMVAPPFIVVDYPGMGKVVVPQPVP